MKAKTIPTTVGELIEALKKLPSSTHVLTSGYERGFCDASKTMNIVKYNRNIHGEWYYGPHDLDDVEETIGEKLLAVII